MQGKRTKVICRKKVMRIQGEKIYPTEITPEIRQKSVQALLFRACIGPQDIPNNAQYYLEHGAQGDKHDKSA